MIVKMFDISKDAVVGKLSQSVLRSNGHAEKTHAVLVIPETWAAAPICRPGMRVIQLSPTERATAENITCKRCLKLMGVKQ